MPNTPTALFSPPRRAAPLHLLLAAVLSATVAGCTLLPTHAPSPAPAPNAGVSVSATVPFTDSLGMRFVHVPAGEFLMGSDEHPAVLARAFPHADAARLADLTDEAPVHRVRITRSFWLGSHEVTVGQFRRFLQASGYIPESVRDGTGAYGFNPNYDPALSERGDLFEGRDPRYSWEQTGFAQTEQHPVVNVTWNDAVAMAEWLSQHEGVRYRLPTEAEWEYAARAGTRTRFPGGDDPAVLLTTANTFEHEAALRWPRWRKQAGAGSDNYPFTAPTGSFMPNAWGLYDMIGNAWEWTADWYAENTYTRTADSKPSSARDSAGAITDDPQGPTEGNVRVRRGGSWHSWPLYARVAFRSYHSPDTRHVLGGFRLLREQGPDAPNAPARH